MAYDANSGEFAFSSVRPDAVTSIDSSADDYEWGDFVKSPQQPQISDPSFNSLIGNENPPLHDSASPLRWVKPSGALPLSFFGAAEEDEGVSSVDFDRESGNANTGYVKSNFSDNKLSEYTEFSITDLYTGIAPIKNDGGIASNSEGRFNFFEEGSVAAENGFHSSSDLNGAISEEDVQKIADFDGAVYEKYQNQLIQTDENGMESKLVLFESNQKSDVFGGWSVGFDEFSNSNAANPHGKMSTSSVHMNGGNPKLNIPASDDDSDDGWEFQDAFSETRTVDLSDKVDSIAYEVSPKCTKLSGNEANDLFGTADEPVDLFTMSIESVDFFGNSAGISSSSQEVNLDDSNKESSHISNADTNVNVKQNDIEGNVNPSPDTGEFTSSSFETRPKTGEKDVNFNNNRSAIPLSIFGSEEIESDRSLDVQDAFIQQPSFWRENHSPTSVIPINDLISSLYTQTEKASFSNSTENPTAIQLNLSNSVSSSDLMNDAAYLDDTSWDFKDALSETRVDSETCLYTSEDIYISTTSEQKLDSYLDFYFRLKKELYIISKLHIGNLKSQGNAALSGEDAGIVSITSELQMACKELEHMDYLFEEHEKHDYHPSANSCLSELVESLLRPQFQMLESEYHLSQKLLLAEKDLKSTMELIRHTTTMLKILTLGTLEERKTYMSVWSDLIRVCAQELKHGSLIWTQAVQSHVQKQLLAETEGRSFVLALGEIYRVVVILGASAKLFKLWTVSTFVDSSSIYIHLEKCHSLWSTSGLEEALSCLLESTPDVESLLNSIKIIGGLDSLALQNYAFTEKYPVCQLSMLSSAVAPGLKMIKWEENLYFVTLANMWANLMSPNPPKLMHLHIG